MGGQAEIGGVLFSGRVLFSSLFLSNPLLYLSLSIHPKLRCIEYPSSFVREFS